MNRLPLNVWILTIAQALMMSVSSIVVFVGGLIGSELAPASNLATLPVATIIISTAATVVPVTLLMKKIGRRKSFLLTALYSVVVSLLAAYSIHIQSFYLLCVSFFLFGASVACIMQFRFAAMESVSSVLIPNAASAVLLGGIAAALIGPELAIFGKDLFSIQYVGSFLLLAGIYILSFLILTLFQNPESGQQTTNDVQRPFGQILGQRFFWVAMLSAAVGYMVMSFIMTATPVSMHNMDGHSLQDTKIVIQSHIMAMFLPSLVAGWIIKKLGIKRMMAIGLIAYLICVAIAYSGHHFSNYWMSLVLLGIGWNFLFVGGTTLLPQAYTASERFKVQALNDFIVFGTQAMAALSAGWLVFEFGWETILLFTIPLIIFQLGVTWSFTMKKP
ncbi:MAG: MFS transporter [Cyclobacteriaceae bacterium]